MQNPPRRNETETKRPAVVFEASPKKIYWDSSYLWSAAGAGSTGTGASRSETFTMPFSSEKAR